MEIIGARRQARYQSYMVTSPSFLRPPAATPLDPPEFLCLHSPGAVQIRSQCPPTHVQTFLWLQDGGAQPPGLPRALASLPRPLPCPAHCSCPRTIRVPLTRRALSSLSLSVLGDAAPGSPNDFTYPPRPNSAASFLTLPGRGGWTVLWPVWSVLGGDEHQQGLHSCLLPS